MLSDHFLQYIQQNELGVLLNGIPDLCREDMITRYTNDLIQFNWTRTFSEKKTFHKELEVTCEISIIIFIDILSII